ncbi:MAG: hypothetical protein GC157_07140 [Frankiales bacterium]|nr:hypothetical protein [Frankiales bacterium]
MTEEDSLAIYHAAVAPHAAALEAAGNTEQAQRAYNLATIPLFEEHKARTSSLPQEPEPADPGTDDGSDSDGTSSEPGDGERGSGDGTSGADDAAGDPPADPEQTTAPEPAEQPKPRRASSK